MTKHDITLKVDEYLNKNTVSGFIDSNSGKIIVSTYKNNLVDFIYKLVKDDKEFQIEMND